MEGSSHWDSFFVRISRRTFLRRTVVSTAATLSTFYVWPLVKQARRLLGRISTDPTVGQHLSRQPGPLTHEEMLEILALSEVLVPWPAGNKTVRQLTQALVTVRTNENPDVLAHYQQAVAWLHRWSYQRFGASSFCTLALLQREQLLRDYIGGSFPVSTPTRRFFFPRRDRAIASVGLLATDILTHFYQNPSALEYLGIPLA